MDAIRAPGAVPPSDAILIAVQSSYRLFRIEVTGVISRLRRGSHAVKTAAEGVS